MKANTAMLSPSELSEATGVGRETLRFYEEKGLVIPVNRTAAGYRQYSHSAIELIGFIKKTQQAGFSLKEIDGLLQLRAKTTNTCGDVSDALAHKISAIDEEIAVLHRKRALIDSMNTSCCPSPSPTKPCSFSSAPVIAIECVTSCCPLQQHDG
jgi:MerR family Zn(II)-responsive transcriptional regulator of zntA